jgi:anti-sigma regulatory factor (Ser/Thr protein kinase)
MMKPSVRMKPREGAGVKQDAGEKMETIYPSRGGSAARMRRALGRYLHERALDAGVIYDVVLAADEAFVNAVSHAEAVDGDIHVTACVSDGEAAIEVRDDGAGFTPRPPGPQPLPDVRCAHGRGLFLIECLMDEVSVRSGRSGTTVRMVRHLG